MGNITTKPFHNVVLIKIGIWYFKGLLQTYLGIYACVILSDFCESLREEYLSGPIQMKFKDTLKVKLFPLVDLSDNDKSLEKQWTW